MPATKAQQRAVAKYMKANYDEVKLRIPKGRKDEILTFAVAAGQSLNGYVVQSVDERIAREKGDEEHDANL